MTYATRSALPTYQGTKPKLHTLSNWSGREYRWQLQVKSFWLSRINGNWLSIVAALIVLPASGETLVSLSHTFALVFRIAEVSGAYVSGLRSSFVLHCRLDLHAAFDYNGRSPALGGSPYSPGNRARMAKQPEGASRGNMTPYAFPL